MRTWQRSAMVSGLVAAVLAVAGCSAEPDEDPLAAYGLAGLTGQEIVEQLDTSTEARPLAFGASVREDEVLLSDGSTETSVPLPEDVQYLSIAPYLTTTHDCYYHSLATCQGELVGQDVHVTITDDAGEVLVDETATTYTNGFVGFWVPRDVTGTITVTADGLTGAIPFTTEPGSPTCLTTLQLA